MRAKRYSGAMRRGSVRGRTAIGLLVAGCLLAPAATASASVEKVGDYKFVDKRFKVKEDRLARFFVECPKGTTVVAGGQESVLAEDSVRSVFDLPGDSKKDKDRKPDDGWTTVVESSGFGSGYVDVFAEAVCWKTPKKAKQRPVYRTDRFPVGEGAQQLISPRCRNDEVALDFGIRDDPLTNRGSSIAINSSTPQGGQGWGAFIDSFAAGGSFVETTLVCSTKLKPELVVGPSLLADQGSHLATATCSGNKVALSGGQSNSGGFDDLIQVSSSTANENSHVARVINLTNGDLSVTGYAQCIKP